jgi:hypothetical protein
MFGMGRSRLYTFLTPPPRIPSRNLMRIRATSPRMDSSRNSRHGRIRRIGMVESKWQRRWGRIVDWLGACKPLDLILGSMILITAIAMIARAV